MRNCSGREERGGGEGGHLKCVHLRTRGQEDGGVTLLAHISTCTVSFYGFGSMFVLWCLELFVEM